MSNLNKALSDISDIRAQIAAARLFRGFGPFVIGLTGTLAICVMALQLVRPEKFAGSVESYMMVWLVIAGLSLAFIIAEMWALSQRHHRGLAFQMVRKVAEGFAPSLLAGTVIGIILLGQNSDFAVYLPALWQYMIAIGLFASMGSLHRNIYLVAIWYFCCATAVFFLISSGQNLSPLHMGLPFGIGQILMGLVLAYSFPKPKESADELVFKNLCSLTDGNLSRHIKVLSEAGFVSIEKSFVDNRPQTFCRVTEAGQSAFATYIEVLESIVKDATSLPSHSPILKRT